MDTQQEQLRDLKKQIVKIQILGSPGIILIALALYAIFVADGDAFIAILNNMLVVYILLALGVVIQLWEIARLVPLLKKMGELNGKW